jgi:hypothetical protein
LRATPAKDIVLNERSITISMLGAMSEVGVIDTVIEKAAGPFNVQEEESKYAG